MHRLIALSNPRQAQSFIDYMATRGITLSLAPEPEGMFAIWLADSQHLVEVEAELRRFMTNPADSRYQAASWEVADSRTAKFYYGNTSMLKLIKSQAGPVTLTVMVVIAVIYAAWLLGLQQPLFLALHFPAQSGELWQIWRWFSHALLHFSLLHIVFNALWWWLLGGQLERHSGSGKLLQIFFLSALFSGLAQYAAEDANFGGLSGVVYALLGYLWWLGWLAPERRLSIPKPYVVFMLVWLVIGFMQPMGMAIANMAHLVGLLSGCMIALFDAKLSQNH